jgi:hypothetical protein
LAAAAQGRVAASYRPDAPAPIDAPARASVPLQLDWTPPELDALGAQASLKNSFVLDRTMLGVAASLLPESEAAARQSVRKLDGVSVHLYRFRDYGAIDPDQIERVRQAYHARGWKHMVTAAKTGLPIRDGKADFWLVTDGIDIRGGTLMMVTPKSVSVVTFAGNLNPIDLLHLRGHFGIPNFSGDSLQESR